jgi:N-methylhydantoinase A/oxoprolinase/acetone carboxylase beta subunit
MGGKEATITDALLVMGLLDPKTYFGGEMKLDLERARSVIAENIAGSLGMSVEQAAHAMLSAWAQDIAHGLANYTEITPATVLTAFGGGGPMAVLAVAEAAGIETVLVPRLSAVFSAHGIGFSDIAHRAEQKLTANTQSTLETAVQELRVRIERDMFSEGFTLDECRQEAWLQVNNDIQPLDAAAPTLHTTVGDSDEVIIGLRAVKSVNRAELPAMAEVESHEPRIDSLRVLLNADGSTQDLPIIKVENQQPGARGFGPAVIEEAFWTCKVLPGWSYEFTVNGDVLFKKKENKKQNNHNRSTRT